MKRDMELIRLLLLQVEGEDPKLDLSKYDPKALNYHAALLVEAGLVHGSALNDGNGDPIDCRISRLTWEGHEFLDAARDETAWKKVKEVTDNFTTTVAFPVLTALLSDWAKKQLGLS